MNSSSKFSVFIAYGFCEGKRASIEFNKCLLSNGFRVVKAIDQADIILAHSGGCFVIPGDTKGKLILLIGLPHWPGKSLAKAIYQKVNKDFDFYQSNGITNKWLKKFLLHMYYFFNFKNNLAMLVGRQNYIENLGSNSTVLIRNKDDTITIPKFSQLPKQNISTFISLNGQHDDCWINPDTYLKIMSELAQQYSLKTDKV